MSSVPTSPSPSSPDAAPRTARLIWLVVLMALVLRLAGIGWGLPNSDRLFSYHPDESVVTGYSLIVNPLLLLLDPGFYNYGSLALLVNGLFIHLGEWFHLVLPGPGPTIPSASALLTARLVTAVLGTTTCGFLYGVGRFLFRPSVGLWAAALYAIAPLAVQHGHFATVDVPAVFWLTGSLYFAARYTSKEPGQRDLWWAGLWAGLAAATKYNAGLVVLSGIAAWLVVRPRNPRQLIGLVGGVVLGFLVGCPGVVLNFAAFRAGLTYEAQHVREGHGDVFVNTPSGFIYHISFNLFWGVGFPLMLLSLVAIGYALYRRRPADLILAAFALPYYILIGLAQVKFARYTLPLLPPLFLWIGALLPAPDRSTTSRATKPATSALRILLIGSAAYAALMACAFDRAMLGVDPRDAAAAYIRSHNIASVGFATGPWFYSPPLQPGLAAPAPAAAKNFALHAENPRLIPAEGEWNVSQISGDDAPQTISLSELNEYADAQRVGVPAALDYLKTLTARYPNRQVFASPLTVLGIPFTTLQMQRGGKEILPTQNLPHDMLYTNPTTVLFSQ